MTDTFLLEDTPALLRRLHADKEPLWGEMNALQMVDHIYQGLVLSQNPKKWDVRTPEDKLAGARAFLMSEKPLPRHAPLPEGFVAEKVSPSPNLEAAIDRFLNEVPTFLKSLDQPNFFVWHPDFGQLNAEEILTLMRKHVRHHLAQFGLIER